MTACCFFSIPYSHIRFSYLLSPGCHTLLLLLPFWCPCEVTFFLSLLTSNHKRELIPGSFEDFSPVCSDFYLIYQGSFLNTLFYYVPPLLYHGTHGPSGIELMCSLIRPPLMSSRRQTHLICKHVVTLFRKQFAKCPVV